MSVGKVIKLWFFLILLTMLGGCNSGDSGDDGSPAPDPIQKDLSTDTLTVRTFSSTRSYRTTLLESEDLEDLSVEPETYRIIVRPSSRLSGIIEKGDILRTGISETFPQELVGKVKKITEYRDPKEPEEPEDSLDPLGSQGSQGSQGTQDALGSQGSLELLMERTFDFTPLEKIIVLEQSDFKSISINPETYRVIVPSSSPLYNTIKQWDILIGKMTANLPQGLLGRVKEITRYKDFKELILDVPPLESAFKYLTMDLGKTITMSDIIQEKVYPGVDIEDRNGKILLTVDSLVNDRDGLLSTTDDQIRVKGEVVLDLGFDLELDINLWTLRYLGFKPHVKQSGQLTFSSGSASEVDATMLLAVLKTEPFAMGALVLAPEIQLFLNTSGKFSSQATIGMEFEHDYSQLLDYDGTSLRVTDQDNDQVMVSYLEPEIAAALDTNALISPHLDLKLFGRSGFSCNYTDRFSATALVRTDTDQICWELGSSFDTQSQVELNLFVDHDLEDDQLKFFHAVKNEILEESCGYLPFYHPVAVAGGNLPVKEIKEGEDITLDGRGSYDSDDGDGIYSYAWIQTDGPTVTLQNADTAEAGFTAPQVNSSGQDCVFELTVTDFSGHVDRESVRFSIKDEDGLPKVPGFLTGLLVDYDTGEPMEDVLVEAFERKTGDTTESLIGSALTGEKGRFIIRTLADGCRVELSKDGFHPLKFKDIAVGSDRVTALGKIQLLDDSKSGKGDITITLKDILSEAGIRNATLELFHYLDEDAIKTVTTDMDGTGVFTDIIAGAYFVTAQGSGYHKATFSVAAHDGADPEIKTLEPKMDSIDEIRLVLSWGSPNPDPALDLDSHLVAPTPSGERFHLFYPYMHTSNPQGRNIVLKRDDGPPRGIETIVIKNRFEGTYTYRVHDHTNNDSKDSPALSSSGAVVTVFKGVKVDRVILPPNQAGNLWEVLTIDGKTGDISLVNTMTHHTVSELIQMAGSYSTSYNVSAK
jgi:hypothetical protein